MYFVFGFVCYDWALFSLSKTVLLPTGGNTYGNHFGQFDASADQQSAW
jgi:hypothetical protein